MARLARLAGVLAGKAGLEDEGEEVQQILHTLTRLLKRANLKTLKAEWDALDLEVDIPLGVALDLEYDVPIDVALENYYQADSLLRRMDDGPRNL